MIKQIDWYIIRKFLGTYLFMMVVIMSISVVFDISEKIEDFIRRDAPLEEIIFDYYINFIIYYSSLFSALFIFLTVLFFTSKMAKNTEIVPILSSGISFNRFLRPYFLVATLLAVFSLLMNHFVIPPANRARLEFEQIYNNSTYTISNLHKEASPGTMVYFKYFRSDQNILHDFWISRRDPDTGELLQVLHAEQAFGDTVTNEWELKQCFVRTFTEGNTSHDFRSTPRIDTVLDFNIGYFTTRREIVSAMAYAELKEYIEEEEAKGSKNVPFYKIEMHQRTSYPMASFILTMIGVSISSRKSRDGIGMPIATGIVISLLYIFAMKMTTVAALNVGFPAFWAVWTPNIIFLGVAYVFYRKAPK